ncbi:hypothetical protein [Oscillibacter sp. CU971]|jgi:hypothetical protein|uniref:hypothetical protein n=1 Tax=Oscillibacter sp. CU971 TaxID=2780102 RepID=UPI00195D1A4F|nr:hypothetical protein [Oscillibacter sp. CU971]
MSTVLTQKISAPVVRQYEIGGVRYIVKASVSGRASESAITKINRLIQGDLEKKKSQP